MIEQWLCKQRHFNQMRPYTFKIIKVTFGHKKNQQKMKQKFQHKDYNYVNSVQKGTGKMKLTDVESNGTLTFLPLNTFLCQIYIMRFAQ